MSPPARAQVYPQAQTQDNQSHNANNDDYILDFRRKYSKIHPSQLQSFENFWESLIGRQKFKTEWIKTSVADKTV